MPRSRGRRRIVRPRLSRMDAAVDAMQPLGFPIGKIKKHVKQLLKVYGGDEGWPFIEEFSYKVLLDSILEERDDEEQVSQSGNLLEDKSRDDKESDCSQAADSIESLAAAVAETTPLPASSPSRDSTPLLLPANRRTRVPCYGWIESDEDDADQFIVLRPASTVVGERATLKVTTWRKKRRSGWDVKPGDP